VTAVSGRGTGAFEFCSRCITHARAATEARNDTSRVLVQASRVSAKRRGT